MAFQPLLRHRAAPVAALTMASFALYPRTAYAEELTHHTRKPIYDSPLSTTPSPAAIHETTLNPEPVTPPVRDNQSQTSKVSVEQVAARVFGQPANPTPTQRLADQIKRARVFLHAQAVKAENNIDSGLTKALNLEHSFISTLQ
ncbi:hypothetical protein E4T45_06928, partial [Aureobasidium sp. EXF-8846]